MAAAFGFVARGVSYCMLAMKSPKAPPRAKPITPETTVFPGQDSITADICFPDSLLAEVIGLKAWRKTMGGTRERTAFTAAMVCSSAILPPPGGLKAGLPFMAKGMVLYDGNSKAES